MSLKFLRTVEKTKKFVLPKALVDSNIIDFGRQLFIKTINRSAALEKAIADEVAKKLREEKPLVYGYGSSINCFSSAGISP